MHRLLVGAALLALAVVLHQAYAQAQSAPGAGHGFLIDKHRAAGINCAGCHSAAPPPNVPQMSACLGCHGSYSQIAAKTASDEPNPHASHLGELACTACHHVHKASEAVCTECHAFSMSPP
ncbi:MAG TPA: cytochrome c3 family protein [Chloroflexota bacterium]|nr:cytochrome c3 family protein [Chloroflexota bacterium]